MAIPVRTSPSVRSDAARPGSAQAYASSRARVARDDVATEQGEAPARSAHIPSIGRVLAGRYELRSILGSGSYGQVFAAWDLVRARMIALKVLKDTRPDALLQFKQEFRALNELKHRNLVRFLKLGRDADLWFIVMELIEGGPITTALPDDPSDDLPPSHLLLTTVENGSIPAEPPHAPSGIAEFELPIRGHVTPLFPLEELRDRLGQLTEGILTLHRFGIIHCDLKPSNVMVTRDGRVVILDFGVARFTMPLGAHLERGSAYAGTWPYMAPELKSQPKATPALDWYALGMMLAELLTGHAPTALAATPHEKLLALFAHAAELHEEYADFYRVAGELLSPDPDARADHSQLLALCYPGREAEIQAMAQGRAYSFFGREPELNALRQSLRNYLDGKPTTLIVEGEAGIGKTTLCGEFLRQVTLEGGAPYILLARCKNDELLGFRAFDELIDGLAALLRSLPEDERAEFLPYCTPALTELFPTLRFFAQATDETRRGAAALNSSSEDALYALQALLRRIAERRKIILWVEDVHQADRDSHRWVARIFAPGDRPNVFLLLSKRPTHPSAVNGVDIDTLGYAVPTLTLRPLDRATARQALVRWLPPSHADDETLIETLLTAGRGHPYMLYELCRYAGDVGDIPSTLSLTTLLSERLATLPAPHLLTLNAIARSFGAPRRSHLGEVTGLSVTEVDDALEDLEARSLIRPAATADDERFELAHVAVSEAVDALTSLEQRVVLHARYAQLGIDTQDQRGENGRRIRPAVIVAHLVRANDPQRAESYALELATASDRAGAYETAALMYELLMQIARERGRRVDADLRLRAVECQLRTGRLLDAANLLVELAMESRRELARGYRRRAAEAYILSGHIAEGNRQNQLADGERGAIIQIPMPRGARVLMLQRRLAQRLDNFDPAATRVGELEESDDAIVRTYRMAGIDIGMIDSVSAYEFSMRELDFALDTNLRGPIVRALSSFAAFAGMSGSRNSERGRKWIDLALHMAEDLDDISTREWARTCAAALDYHHGFYRRSWKKVTETYAWVEANASHQSMMLSYLEMHRLFLTIHLGEMDQLRSAYYGQIVEARARKNRLMEASVTLTGFTTWLVDDAPEPGRAALRRALLHTPRKGYQLYDYLHQRSICELLLYTQPGDEYDDALAHLRRFEMTTMAMSLEMCRHESRLIRGRLMMARAAARKQLPRADALELHAMGRSLTRSDVPLSCGWGHQLLAGMYALQGRRRKAAAHLQKMIEIFQQAGVKSHAAVTRAAGQLACLTPATEDDPYAELRAMGVVNPARFIRSHHPYVDLVAARYCAAPGVSER